MAGILPLCRVQPVPASTFPQLLADALRSDGGRPLVTFYDDASGERVELSVATYANWVAKSACLLQDELEVEHGGTAVLDVPTHWLGAVCLGAAWSLGLRVTDDAAVAADADLVVCGPEALSSYAALAARVPVLALSLRPLGGRFLEALPDGVIDYGAVVLAEPDLFVPDDPPAGGDEAWYDGSTQAELLDEAAHDGLLGPGGRLLTDMNPCTREGVRTLLAPLTARGGTVWVRNPDAAGWQHRSESERTTAELRQ
jgi:uncharacterized protein (TIGR03089 family)